MSRASQAAAELGWKLFVASEGVTSREEINVELAKGNLRPISERMFDHYRRLDRHGIDEYVPINELDISVKHGRLEKRSA